MRNGRFSNDLVTSNVDLNVILAKNDCTNDKKVTKKKEKLYDISKLSVSKWEAWICYTIHMLEVFTREITVEWRNLGQDI